MLCFKYKETTRMLHKSYTNQQLIGPKTFLEMLNPQLKFLQLLMRYEFLNYSFDSMKKRKQVTANEIVFDCRANFAFQSTHTVAADYQLWEDV